MSEAAGRISEYTAGKFNLIEPPESDVAFQVAKLINQAGLGPGTRKLLDFAIAVKEDPSIIKALGVAKLFLQIEEIRAEFENRDLARAGEAQALLDRLKSESKVCTMRNWPTRCQQLNFEISEWINSGATQ